jgi:hypothetical protein
MFPVSSNKISFSILIFISDPTIVKLFNFFNFCHSPLCEELKKILHIFSAILNSSNPHLVRFFSYPSSWLEHPRLLKMYVMCFL